MKRSLFALLLILGLLSLFGCGNIMNSDENTIQNTDVTDITVIETDLLFNVEDVADAFNVTESFYFPDREALLKLNEAEPKGFYYLDGVLLVYIFTSEEECVKAIKNINEILTEEKLLDAATLYFKQADFEPVVYKANNALVAYVPRYTIRTKMNQSMERLSFMKEARGKGLTTRMLNTLGNLGYSEQEILDLPQEDIKLIFAPGTHLDGMGFDPDDVQKSELSKVGIDMGMSVILFNLGYEYEEMLALSPEELDFIFPNTELIANLAEKGFDKQEVQTWVVNESGRTYKELIKEALER
ncbi:hypothetical protein SDC9_04852 [bioreactor metagenome]|uniref:Uncharacterized protein n=1 Tax=bioreactor metagenome TaxID=1076179 RepID=A0A644SXH4_9ZZZZ|nr:hypothetical protein [Desulfitobacterium hafniense]MEA5021352.1 hypothetical protein [Desulfitobacterium hafniense]